VTVATKENKSTAPVSPIATEVKRPVKPLEQRRLKLICSSASDLGNEWAIVVPSGTTIETILDPAYYANVASSLRIADSITAHWDDRSALAKLYITDTARTRVSVSKIFHVELDAPAESSEPKAYRVRYDGPHTKWCVVRVSDGRVVKDGCETKESAEIAMRAHEQAESRKVA
jgi:hypothetical protein